MWVEFLSLGSQGFQQPVLSGAAPTERRRKLKCIPVPSSMPALLGFICVLSGPCSSPTSLVGKHAPWGA